MKIEHLKRYYLGSFLYGFVLKLLPIFVVFIMLFIYYSMNDIQLPNNFLIAGKQPPNIVKYFIYSIILAPLIENLLLLIASAIGSKTSDQWIIPSIFLSLVIYFSHGGSLIGILSVIAFLGMYIQFEYLKNKINKPNAFFCTVLTHASANIVTYAFILLRS